MSVRRRRLRAKRGQNCILCGGRRKKIVKYAKKMTKKENVLIKFFFLV